MFWALLLTAILIWTAYYRWQRQRIYKLVKEVPLCDLPMLPILGHAHLLAGTDEDRMNANMACWRIANKNGGQCGIWMANKYYVVISDPTIAEVVLKSCLEKDDTMMKYTRSVTGNGSVFAPVKIWRPRRKILAPVFALKNLNSFGDIFSTQSAIMVKLLQHEAGRGDFSIWNYMATYSFDAVCETALGVELNSQRQPDHPFLHAFDLILQLVSQRLSCPWLYSDFVYKRLRRYKKFCTCRKIMYDFVDELIKRKRLELAKRELANGAEIKAGDTAPETRTFLEMVIESSGGAKGYTDLELREEVLVIIMAGTDTSAVGAAYTSVMLSRHPGVQDKVVQELEEVFQGSSRPLTVKDLAKLKYLEAVIKETLRLYPPVPVIVREVNGNVELPSGITLVDGVGIINSIWATHRNPKYWGEDADQFRPERFLEGPLKHPAQFMPFSYSLRNCVGSTYAMMSMKTVLATLLRQYRLLPPADLEPQQWTAPLRVKYDIMMKHVDNYVMRIEHRKTGIKLF